MTVRYVPLDSFLFALAEGWRFVSYVVEPMQGYHGTFAVLMERDEL